VISAVLALGFDLLCGLSFLSQQESHDRYSALLDVEIWGDRHKTIPNFIAVDIVSLFNLTCKLNRNVFLNSSKIKS
jgi:hypothetical protein